MILKNKASNMAYNVHFQKVECAAGATHTQLFENAADAFPL